MIDLDNMINIIHGDSATVLSELDDNTVDLIFTSPPYADLRRGLYNSISVAEYADWFLPIAQQMRRVLKPTGSFFLNLKPHVHKWQRLLYVWELVIRLVKEQDWYLVDELAWVKQGFPGRFDGRFRNAFEPIYHFSKGSPRHIKFHPLACGTVTLEDSRRRALTGGKYSSNGSGFNTPPKLNALSRPDNVLRINNYTAGLGPNSRKGLHPATFPTKLVDFFIKSYTDEGDLVLDPFAGSGTTGVSCRMLNRNAILIDNKLEYVELMQERVWKDQW